MPPVNGFDDAKNKVPVYSSDEMDTIDSGKQDKAIVRSVTLAANGWSDVVGGKQQSVTVAGVTSTNTVIVSPAPLSIEDYSAKKVYCSAQAENSLTFKCTSNPAGDLSVNVVIL